MADFSRDGKWVVYVTYPERDVWRTRVDGAEALQLTHGALRARMPRISPDARQVTFTGDYSGKVMRAWLVNFDGGEPRPATHLAAGAAEVAPAWSPDGARLLFRLDRAVQRNLPQILDLPSGKIEDVPDSEQKLNQRWSPDGKRIAAKGVWTTLTQMRVDYPNWSRNSDYVYFSTRFESGEEAIYRVSLASRNTERVTSLVGTPRAFNEIYNQWVGLAPDDSPLILRSADLQQIYLLSFAGR
jgi:Tol biopolymer transport system component